MLATRTMLSFGILSLSFANIAVADDSDQTTCLLQCSTTAAVATGCADILNNQTCVCASPVYASNLTQCATTNCSLSTDDITQLITSGCAEATASASTPSGSAGSTSGSRSASAASSSASDKPNSADMNDRLGFAAVSVIGLVFAGLIL